MKSPQNPKKQRNDDQSGNASGKTSGKGQGIPTIIDVDAGTLLLIIGLAIALPLFLTGLFAS